MWHFNGAKLSQSTEKQQILANGTLVIRQATLSDAGDYKCTASRASHGPEIEAVANVRVIGRYMEYLVERGQQMEQKKEFINWMDWG